MSLFVLHKRQLIWLPFECSEQCKLWSVDWRTPPLVEASHFVQTKNASVSLAFFLVVWGGIEPPTQGFSVLCSTD